MEMKHMNMYASMEIKHATSINQNLFLLFAIQKHICINNKEDKYFSPLSNENMHINSNTSPPFCQSSTKGSK